MFFVEQKASGAVGRKPVRTGVWLDGPEGSLELVDRDGLWYRIAPVEGRWRLSCGEPGSVGHRRGYESWESDTRDDCLGMADFMRRAKALEAAWCERNVPRVERPSHLPGIDLSASKRGGTVIARATETETGREVGTFHAAYTGWRGAWVIGEETVSTSSSVSPELIGTGLGRSLYDLVEEMAGLPLVPHGVNFVGGGRTDDSRRFWERRAAHVRVPGFDDPAVDARNAVMAEVDGRLRIELRRVDPEIALAVALRTDMQVEVILSKTGLGPRPIVAWCVGPDGRAVTTWGFEDRDALIAHAAPHSDPEPAAPVATDAEGLAAMIGAYNGELFQEPPVPHVPHAADFRIADIIVARHALDAPAPVACAR